MEEPTTECDLRFRTFQGWRCHDGRERRELSQFGGGQWLRRNLSATHQSRVCSGALPLAAPARADAQHQSH
jgi:hypothetical protein